MEPGMETTWFSEQDWDHIFNISPPPHVDWGDNTNTQSAPELSDVDLDAAEWLSWADLICIDGNNGCSVNNTALPADLQAMEDYLMDSDLQDANNIMEISQSDDIILQRPMNNTDPVIIIEDPAAGDQLSSDCDLIDGDQLASDCAVVTNQASLSSAYIDHGALENMEYKGLRLLHLLTACAEAMSQGAQDLVEVMLCRLRGLVSPTGSTMERVAYYLFDALLQYSNVNSLAHLKPANDKSSTQDHFLGALKLLHLAYPYIQIPHFTANQCILEAVSAAGGAAVGIHIIDFDIMEGTQWPPLMEALRNNGNYDVIQLRITAIKWTKDEEECLPYSGNTGRRLSEYASSVGIPFSFQETDLKGLKDVPPFQEGEIAIVNCIWQLPHMLNLRNKSELLEFLVGARHLNPVAVTLATGQHGAERDSANFLESFCRCLEQLCTIFDSLEAGLPEHGLARAMIERIFFGPAMSRRVVLSSSACGDHGPSDTRESNVVDLPLKCGYGEGSVSNDNVMFAKYSLLCCGGSGSCELELVGHHRLVLKWGSTPLVWVSAWKSIDNTEVAID